MILDLMQCSFLSQQDLEPPRVENVLNIVLSPPY